MPCERPLLCRPCITGSAQATCHTSRLFNPGTRLQQRLLAGVVEVLDCCRHANGKFYPRNIWFRQVDSKVANSAAQLLSSVFNKKLSAPVCIQQSPPKYREFASSRQKASLQTEVRCHMTAPRPTHPQHLNGCLMLLSTITFTLFTKYTMDVGTSHTCKGEAE